MEMLKRDMITVKDIKGRYSKCTPLEKPVEGEDFDDRYDRLHTEWLVKGLKNIVRRLMIILLIIRTLKVG